MDEFVNRLRAWRDRRAFSQDQAAKRLGIVRSYYNQIENGKRVPGDDVVNIFESDCSLDASTPRGKLTVAIRRNDLTPAQLAKKIGYDSGVINNVIRGAGRASEEMIDRIVKVLPELSKEELMGGSDETPMIREHGAEVYGAKPTIQLPPGMKGRMLPLLSNAQAGGWDAGHSDEGWHGECVFALNVDDRRAFAIRVSGNSMEPEIREGDVVVCSPSQQVREGVCAVVRTKSDQAFVKFWHKKGDTVILESANPDYEAIRFPQAEIAGAWPVIQRILAGFVQKGV